MQTYLILKRISICVLRKILHSVRLGASLWQHVTYVTIDLLNLENKEVNSLSYRNNALNCLIIQTTHTVGMLATLAIYKRFWSKITTSYCVMRVT